MDYSQYKVLEFRRAFFKLLGAEITVQDPATGLTVGFIRMKAWTLREDIRVYTDSSQDKEVLRIHARSIMDFGATYDVFDSQTDKVIFSLRRKGLKSTFVRDQWEILDTEEDPIATVLETSSGLALVRRYVDLIPVVGIFIDLALSMVPLTYTITAKGEDNTTGTVARIVHRKNPFIVKMSLDRTDADTELDSRIGVAATALLSVIDASKG